MSNAFLELEQGVVRVLNHQEFLIVGTPFGSVVVNL